ncbi:MAG: hypothetical protein HYT40_03255 [Candidatus Sungbacteria bacterium]|uniref:Uncharacterized protein n=1 Tax=Candidatus Sungiibacteriota bacterium TaxID=2750080 RepID=A0A931WPV0_9BACT|nr:hypothetical protein [Candidatus Sungbacteria bacterium]
MKFNICPICVSVSLAWLLISAGVAWGYLSSSTYLIPIALLMGGTVVGIAYLGERRYAWAARHPQTWKTLIILFGMPTAYFIVTHLTKFNLALTLLFLIIVGYFLFIQRPKRVAGGPSDSQKLRELEEKMKQCC